MVDRLKQKSAAIRAPAALRGAVKVPGDKSISHRALMLSALAVGESRISGLLEGEDVLATAAALQAMGASIERSVDAEWQVQGVGVGGLIQPLQPLEMGNSGTSTRLLMGLVASHPLTVTFTGDASLTKRPMGRVIEPLSLMGAEVAASPGGRLPLMVRGLCPAVPIDYRLPIASAQVKSAILFAGLNTPGSTRVAEPVATRDHTERMLATFGADITIGSEDTGRSITLRGNADLLPQTITIPGDFSSAAFFIVAATIVPGSVVRINNVGLNPTRTGLLNILGQMGANITFADNREVGGEPVADLIVRHASLNACDHDPNRAATMIDEYPIMFVAASLAKGRSVIRDIGELRFKESDRIATMVKELRLLGVQVEEYDDGVAIEGRDGEPFTGGGISATCLDHRIAMSMLVAGLHAKKPVWIDDATPIATSFPNFAALLYALGAEPVHS